MYGGAGRQHARHDFHRTGTRGDRPRPVAAAAQGPRRLQEVSTVYHVLNRIARYHHPSELRGRFVPCLFFFFSFECNVTIPAKMYAAKVRLLKFAKTIVTIFCKVQIVSREYNVVSDFDRE